VAIAEITAIGKNSIFLGKGSSRWKGFFRMASGNCWAGIAKGSFSWTLKAIGAKAQEIPLITLWKNQAKQI